MLIFSSIVGSSFLGVLWNRLPPVALLSLNPVAITVILISFFFNLSVLDVPKITLASETIYSVIIFAAS